jgi:hypothetical protein
MVLVHQEEVQVLPPELALGSNHRPIRARELIRSGYVRVQSRSAGYGFAHHFTVGDGKIVRFREYADPGPGLLS